ncbi:FMN-binding negative transcriptional regulator [Massilia yuzhufengensis]|uniref:Negative transcriptional regulator, PaiB family n=1 Tax=Massilia yuzhufengensis TaxID=1164594 RepID=A0A1I1NWH6_9BURK|nr:FMN-binding negative transcriptional regulator [Massilia yuzhufengensis]SFD02041.1 negative transcriptional regulator, PaiB family [Massilia yuzhufengensis]
MYLPTRHRQADVQAMQALIAQHALGTLVTHDGALPDADHLPFEFAEGGPHGLLRAHVARANPVWRRAGQQVLAVFRGPAAYVPPDQQEKAATGGRVVPTWDYHVVHVHGRLRAVEDPAWLLALLHGQTAHHEGPQPHPWSVGDAPPAYIDGMLRAIVGIEIEIERMEGKWKGMPQPIRAHDSTTHAT